MTGRTAPPSGLTQWRPTTPPAAAGGVASSPVATDGWGHRGRPMSTWRLEWLRLARSPRGIALGVVYVLLGMVGPALARYLPELANGPSGSMKLVQPTPTARDGIVSFVNEASQNGIVVVVIVAASALALDHRRGIATFFRTRAASMRSLVIPRFAVNVVAAVVAYALGTIAAWYGTAQLIGPLPAGAVTAGMFCGAIYLAFAVAVVAAAASFVRSAVGTIVLSLGALVLLPLLGSVHALHPWLPSTLVGAPGDLLGANRFFDFVPALAVAAVATPALLVLACRRLAGREV